MPEASSETKIETFGQSSIFTLEAFKSSLALRITQKLLWLLVIIAIIQ